MVRPLRAGPTPTTTWGRSVQRLVKGPLRAGCLPLSVPFPSAAPPAVSNLVGCPGSHRTEATEARPWRLSRALGPRPGSQQPFAGACAGHLAADSSPDRLAACALLGCSLRSTRPVSTGCARQRRKPPPGAATEGPAGLSSAQPQQPRWPRAGRLPPPARQSSWPLPRCEPAGATQARRKLLQPEAAAQRLRLRLQPVAAAQGGVVCATDTQCNASSLDSRAYGQESCATSRASTRAPSARSCQKLQSTAARLGVLVHGQSCCAGTPRRAGLRPGTAVQTSPASTRGSAARTCQATPPTSTGASTGRSCGATPPLLDVCVYG